MPPRTNKLNRKRNKERNKNPGTVLPMGARSLCCHDKRQKEKCIYRSVAGLPMTVLAAWATSHASGCAIHSQGSTYCSLYGLVYYYYRCNSDCRLVVRLCGPECVWCLLCDPYNKLASNSGKLEKRKWSVNDFVEMQLPNESIKFNWKNNFFLFENFELQTNPVAGSTCYSIFFRSD